MYKKTNDLPLNMVHGPLAIVMNLKFAIDSIYGYTRCPKKIVPHLSGYCEGAVGSIISVFASGFCTVA